MHKNFWVPRDAGCIAEENMGYENSSKSKAEPKRSHQWFMNANAGEPQVFTNKNKKQAFEAFNGTPISEASQINVSPWDTNLGVPSLTPQFSQPDTRAVDKNMPSIASKNFENQYGNDPPHGLSISHAIEDPSSCISFGGIRKVNQVRDSDNCMPSSSGHSYDRSGNSAISIGVGYSKDDNTFSRETTLSKTSDDNLVPVGHTLNKGEGTFMLMGHNYGNGDGNFISMGQSYEKEDGHVTSLVTSYHKGHENFVSIGSTYSKSRENFITVSASYDKGTDHMISVGPTYDKVDSGIASTVPLYDKRDSRCLPVDHNHNKDAGITMCIGDSHDDSESNLSAGIIGDYDLLVGNQTSDQGLDGQKVLAESTSELPVYGNPKSSLSTDIFLKIKEPKITKKVPVNNFPSNVKSLLSTGIFDGVPVKYVSGSQQRNLRGIIKGTGYLCSCDNCKQSKALNAYEFERHAGAKTKHPNNHIYFDNGKSIYAVVQELKNAPQEILFDAIETVTGSTINQKNFRIWKASYQAATRELQRIYGKDEVVIPS